MYDRVWVYFPQYAMVLPFQNYNTEYFFLNSSEKFESVPGFEPQTSKSLAWRSTT